MTTRTDSPITPSRRLLVVLDADSTLIREEAIELLAAEAGSLEMVAEVTERAMRGELDFAESLRKRVATLAGLPTSALAAVQLRMTPTDGAAELIKGVHDAGGFIGVVSGGFHELLDPLSEKLGLDFCRANRLEIANGILTGRVLGDVVDAQTKADTLQEWAAVAGVDMSNTIAVGDGANDIKMIEAAGLGVAFCAKPLVRDQADAIVDTPDLSEILTLAGLKK